MHNYGWFNGVMPELTNPFMASLQAGSVVDDLTSERIPDNDEGVLWGSPINTWAGDMQPLEVAHGLPPHVPRWGSGFKKWMQENSAACSSSIAAFDHAFASGLLRPRSLGDRSARPADPAHHP